MNTQANIYEQSTSKKIYQSDYSTHDLSKISEIYRDEINISIWKRKLSNSLMTSSEYVLDQNPNLEFSEVLQPNNIRQS